MGPTTFICYFAWLCKFSLINVWKQRSTQVFNLHFNQCKAWFKVSPFSGNQTSQMLGSVNVPLAKVHVTIGEPQLYSSLEGKVVYTCESVFQPWKHKTLLGVQEGALCSAVLGSHDLHSIVNSQCNFLAERPFKRYLHVLKQFLQSFKQSLIVEWPLNIHV